MNDTNEQTALDASADSASTEPTPAPAAPKAKRARKSAKPKTKRVSNLKLKRVGDKDHRVDLSHYARVKSASGNASLDNGDDIAKQLRGAELDDVYKLASKVLKEPQKALRERYKHLNPGMQRMNLGNRLRGARDTSATA